MSENNQLLPQMNYFKEEDVLHLLISEEPESASVEISPNITAEMNTAGKLIGVEILHASTYIRDFSTLEPSLVRG
jgi:uncharacterized protein YuzE